MRRMDRCECWRPTRCGTQSFLPAYIEEVATVIEQSMEAINDIADLIATHGENTTLAELPQLLADLTNITIVLKGHVDNLRGVFFKMRNYTI